MKLDLSKAHNANFRASLEIKGETKKIHGHITVSKGGIPTVHWFDERGGLGSWSQKIVEDTCNSFDIDPRDPRDLSQVRKGDTLLRIDPDEDSLVNYCAPSYYYPKVLEVREIWGNVILTVGKERILDSDKNKNALTCGLFVLDPLVDIFEIKLSEAELDPSSIFLTPLDVKPGEIVWAKMSPDSSFALAKFIGKEEGRYVVSFTPHNRIKVSEIKKLSEL